MRQFTAMVVEMLRPDWDEWRNHPVVVRKPHSDEMVTVYRPTTDKQLAAAVRSHFGWRDEDIIVANGQFDDLFRTTALEAAVNSINWQQIITYLEHDYQCNPGW